MGEKALANTSKAESKTRAPAPANEAAGRIAQAPALERTLGNHAVARMRAGSPGDADEAGGGGGAKRDPVQGLLIRDMERAFATSFQDVRIRTDAAAAARAASMGTRAWTDGRSIGFARDAFDPSSRQGRHIIAHEFAHIAQLKGGNRAPVGGVLGFQGTSAAPSGRISDRRLVEIEANAAAHAVAAGRRPAVSAANFGLAHYDDYDPPPGRVITLHDAEGNWLFIFNRGDVRSWERPLVQIFRHYIRRAFSGASPGVAEAWLEQHSDGSNLSLTGGDPRAEGEGDSALVVRIQPGFHGDVVAWMRSNYPDVAPRVVSGDLHDTEDLPPEDAGGGTEPVSEEVLELYRYLLEQFGEHSVFTERHASNVDLLRYHGEHPEAFASLPEQTATAAQTHEPQWTEFLDNWDDFLILVGSGHPEGEAGGVADGIIRFSPSAQLLIHPDMQIHVQGAEVTAEVLFDRGERHNRMINIFPGRAHFDWTVWRDSEIYDSGPTLEMLGGARTYSFDADELGTYAVEVTVTSPYFRDPDEIQLRSADFVVQTEASRSLDTFDQFFVDPADPEMPFIRNASGELELKPDFADQGLDIRRQISQVEFQLGMLDEMERQCAEDASQCRLSARDIAAYRAHYQRRLASMEAVRDRIEEATPAGTAAPSYLVRASFISRETSEAAPLNVDMIVTRREYDGDEDALHFEVLLFDTTFTPDIPQQHDGAAELEAESESTAGWVRVEKQALDEMADHWHSHNDYPDGTIRIAVRLISDPSQIYEISDIDTDNWRKTAQTGLLVVGLVAGVGALVLAPFTGGTSAAVGVLILEGVAAGAAIGSVVLNIEHRIETEGTLQFDRRLAMDMLTVAASLLGVFGSFSRLLANGARVAGAASTFIRLERAAIGLDAAAASADVVSGILLADDVSNAIIAVEADYALRIEQARREGRSDSEIRQLEEQRDRLIARILGGAAISGAFILVSVGSSVFQIAASPLRNGRNFRVRPEIQDLGLRGSRGDIHTRLEEGSITPDERAFLQDALAAPDTARAAAAGDVETGRAAGADGDAAARPDTAEPAIDAARPGHADAEVPRAEGAEAVEPGRVSHPPSPDADAPVRPETEEPGPVRAGGEPEAPARPPTPEEELRADLGDEQFDALSAALGPRLQDALASLGASGVARIARALSPDEFAALARHLGDADILRLVQTLPSQHIRAMLRRDAAHVFADLINDLGHTSLARLLNGMDGDSLFTILTRVTTRRLADYVGQFSEQTIIQWVRSLDAANVGVIMRAYDPPTANSLLTSPPVGRHTLPDPLQNLARLAWRWLGRHGLAVPHGGAVSVPRATTVGPAPVQTGDIGVFFAHGSRSAAPPGLLNVVTLVRRETARRATELRRLWTRAASAGHSESALQTLFNGTGGLPNWASMPQYLKRYLMTPHSNARLQAYFGTALDRETASALNSLSGFFASMGVTATSQSRVRGGIADLVLDGPWGRAILDWTSLSEAGKIQKYRVTSATPGAGTSFATRVTDFLIELLHPGAL